MVPDSELDALVLRKMKGYYLPAGIAFSARFYLTLIGIYHGPVKTDSLRIALFAEAVAQKMRKDPKAAFLGGLFHDTGKLLFPGYLFDGREITTEEYKALKAHARIGFEIWKSLDPLIALCAGLHHPYHDSGNEVTDADFPRDWNTEIIQKGKELAIIVSVCDFIDAATHRHTHLKDGSNRNGNGLKEMLQEKYPDHPEIVEAALIVLSENKK